MVPLERVDEFTWRIPQHGDMRVPGTVYASKPLIDLISGDSSLQQVRNVATLPGIVRHSIAMPDIHQGYGFPIGGVAATRMEDGVVSPGGVGYDINCGVRLVATELEERTVRPRLQELVDALYHAIPAGVGAGAVRRLDRKELRKVMVEGVHWAIGNGYGDAGDVDFIEERGRLDEADPEDVSDRAVERGLGQVGTLGSGNHFFEVQRVETVLRPRRDREGGGGVVRLELPWGGARAESRRGQAEGEGAEPAARAVRPGHSRPGARNGHRRGGGAPGVQGREGRGRGHGRGGSEPDRGTSRADGGGQGLVGPRN